MATTSKTGRGKNKRRREGTSSRTRSRAQRSAPDPRIGQSAQAKPGAQAGAAGAHGMPEDLQAWQANMIELARRIAGEGPARGIATLGAAGEAGGEAAAETAGQLIEAFRRQLESMQRLVEQWDGAQGEATRTMAEMPRRLTDAGARQMQMNGRGLAESADIMLVPLRAAFVPWQLWARAMQDYESTVGQAVTALMMLPLAVSAGQGGRERRGEGGGERHP